MNEQVTAAVESISLEGTSVTDEAMPHTNGDTAGPEGGDEGEDGGGKGLVSAKIREREAAKNAVMEQFTPQINGLKSAAANAWIVYMRFARRALVRSFFFFFLLHYWT
jgi:hypothetical protein